MSRPSCRLSCLPILVCLAGHAFASSFETVWQLGEDDEQQLPFTQETWQTNEPPGSATAKDDDFYLAGTYAGVGTVANEVLANFEHAVTQGDPKNRVHFHLTAAQASATSRLRVSIDLHSGGAWINESIPGFSTHDISVTFNGQPVGTRGNITWNTLLEFTLPASAVNAVAGANVLQIHRTGGGQGGYICFDYLKLEADPDGLADGDNDGMPRWFEESYDLNDADASDAELDLDEDGLSAFQEYQAGTNPLDPDSDNDGLLDGEETATNPLLRDTDGDGLADGDETSTNPLLADTDADGHPDNLELEHGSNPNSAASMPFDFPGAIGLQFISESLSSAALPPGEAAGYFRLPKWNVTPGLPHWRSSGTSLSGSMSGLKNHRGQTTTAAASFTYHHAQEGLHKGPGNERLFAGMIRSESNGSTVTPATVSLTGIPYATYDILVYVGYLFPSTQDNPLPGYTELNGNAGTRRHFLCDSAPPFKGFTEASATTEATRKPGNYVRYRNLSGGSQTLRAVSPVAEPVCIHGIQIIDSGKDSDNDGLKDATEVEFRLNPLVADASADADGDGLSNSAEIAAGTNPHDPDTDKDGLPDGAEAGHGTSPLDPDSDDDTLTDGSEVAGAPFASLPNDADSDNDGFNDAVERAYGTDPMSASNFPPSGPTWNATTNTWTWRIDNIRVLWNHPQSLTGAMASNEVMLCEAVAGLNAGGWEKQAGIGLRYINGKLTHRFRCSQGLFHVAGKPADGFWDADWTLVDRTRDYGFSGHGTADDSKPLRMEFTAVRNGSTGNSWTLNFLLADLTNPASPLTLASKSYTNAVAADASLLNGTANWTNAAGVSGAFDVQLEPGVKTFITTEPVGTPDADSDGMPDSWETTYSFDPNNAADVTQDADGDGATNLREYLAGTNPRDNDSDNDGVLDGLELAHDSDPLSAGSKPAGFDFTANLGDINGDGLSDAWIIWSGGKARLRDADSDGDGMTNLEESQAGTDPDDANSRFSMKSAWSGSDLKLSWTDLPYKAHSVQKSTTLADWQAATGLPVPTISGGERHLLIPSGSLTTDGGFYRATVTPQDTDGDGVEDWVEAMVTGSSVTAANSMGQTVTRANGQPFSGDAVALLERLQGAAPNGGTPGGSSPGTPSATNAARFLMQSTFGPAPEDIAQVRELGYAGWIDRQLSLPPSFLSPYIARIKADAKGAHVDPTYNYNDLDNFIFGNNVTTPFARNAVGAPDQLRQRIAFALSQILVVSRRDANLEEKPAAMADYYDLLVRHSLGNYGDLLQGVATHPAMGWYLSHAGNQKADPSIPRYPDENFARELMQLFSIGLWELNPDGSRKLDAHGEPIPTYDNGGITEMARVFTGLYFAAPYGWGGGGWEDEHFTQPMVMYADRHDFGVKRLPGGFIVPARQPSAENGLQDIRDAVDAIFRHRNTPVFVSRQLIQFLITDNPSPAYVQRIQNVFTNDGNGVRGNLAAVVKAILLDEEARTPATSAGYGKVREPVIRTMHLGRLFRLAEVHPEFVWWNWQENYYGHTKQEPMNSPSVFNFYTPVYQAPGEIRNGGMVSPGFQIVDTFSSISFPNLVWRYLHEGFNSGWEWKFPLDYRDSLRIAENPATLVDHVNLLVCAGSMTARTRSIILTEISEPGLTAKDRVALAVWLAMTSPEGSTQR